MGLTKWLTCAALAATHAVSAAPSAELLDLAARVQYGFYHGDTRTIENAQAGLARLADSPEAQYYRDFAALRRAQLGNSSKQNAAALADCAERALPEGVGKAFAAEAWILIAACAVERGDDRRRAQALAEARRHDKDNPRIALVESWAAQRAARSDPALRATLVETLTAVVESFDAWTPTIDDPDWGYAEALAALAANALERGETRRARDLVERALLLAPEYRIAVDLRGALQGAPRSNRSL